MGNSQDADMAEKKMYIAKLPVMLLSYMAGENDESTNCTIAQYILQHMETIGDITISDLAARCHVSNSSVSRFCREVGLEDFAEFRDALEEKNNDLRFKTQSDTTQGRSADFTLSVISALEMVQASLDYRVLDDLVDDIMAYDQVCIFGALKSASVAFNLQKDLFSYGKRTITKISYAQQLDYIKKIDQEQLIIIFSYTGVYFNYSFVNHILTQKRKSKIYFITSDENTAAKKYCDKVLLFKSRQDYASHPFQLELISSMIAQEYWKRLQDKIENSEDP